jgi:hypothetical protein
MKSQYSLREENEIIFKGQPVIIDVSSNENGYTLVGSENMYGLVPGQLFSETYPSMFTSKYTIGGVQGIPFESDKVYLNFLKKGERVMVQFGEYAEMPIYAKWPNLYNATVAKDQEDFFVRLNFDDNLGGFGDDSLGIKDGHGFDVAFKDSRIEPIGVSIKLRPFNRAIDGVGTRVAVLGTNITPYTKDNARERLFMGKVVRLDDDMNDPVEFDDFIKNSIDPVDKEGHGVYIREKNMFVVEESDEETSPTFQPSGFGGAIKDIIAELLVTGLSKTDSNRVSVAIEDLKAKVGSDWEAQLKASGALPEEAMDIFISLLKDLEKQEQERIEFGAPRFEAPAIPKAKPRGRPKKEKVQPTEPMPSTPDIPAEINEDELSALLDDLINL